MVYEITRNVPWLALIKINLDQHRTLVRISTDPFHQVITDQLIVSGMEPKSWREFRFYGTQTAHSASGMVDSVRWLWYGGGRG